MNNLKNKNIISLAVILAILPSLLFAQTSATQSARNSAPATAHSPAKAAALPSREEIDGALKRTFGYDAAISWDILDIRPSPFPGAAEVLVSLNKQAPNRLLISPDGQNAAVIADVIPFGLNPFASTREKLKAADGPAMGSKTPAITIVEFSDLQCPHCKAAQPVMEKLLAEFPQVRFVFQQFPLPASLHPWALKGSEYADCSAQTNPELFWKYLASIFENQGGIALTTADDKLKELATAAGLDAQKIAACAATPATEARVNKSVELGHSLEVNETPTVFINGRRVKSVASIPWDQLKSLVQFEIDHAGK
jgi:protein-disulfide isomerase